ncbi:MAG: hypothetical protein WB802_14060 [Candidatus Dormiibacterota bacterium]
MIGSPASIAWLSYGAFLQALGVTVIAVQVYRTALLQFGARPPGAVRRWRSTRTWARSAWRRFRRVSEVRQGTASATLALTVAARGRVTDPNDTPVTIELRRRIEDLETARDRLDGAIAKHGRRLDDAGRSHDDLARKVSGLATGGLLVQGWSVVLVVVGLAIATASPWLAQTGWRGLPVALAPLLAFLA